MAFLGRVPVRVVGDAAVDSYLVPSGRDDGTARAVVAAELHGDAALLAQCFGVVWEVLSPAADGGGRVLAFVAASPTVRFGSIPDIVVVAPMGSSITAVPSGSAAAGRAGSPPPPAGLADRPYQAECVARAKEANTIVCLPTGLGKTLIAARLIDDCLRRSPAQRVLFMVPTVPLVAQQAGYCRAHCAHGGLRVIELCGVRMSGWDATAWARCLGECHVLVGTPEVFRTF